MRLRRALIGASAFIAGVMVGAGTALVVTPLSGPEVRNRLRQGLRTFQLGCCETSVHVERVYGALAKDFLQALRQTRCRTVKVLKDTKGAMRTGEGPKGV